MLAAWKGDWVGGGATDELGRAVPTILCRWLYLSVLGGVLVTGCVPTRNTIGGHDDAELKDWALRAERLCLERTGQKPPNSFTTDGCTLFPDGTWQSCCVEHDMAYWCGGRAEERRIADIEVKACVGKKGGGSAAVIMYWGVRLGGVPWLPTYWRWGYGWSWPHGYTDGEGRRVRREVNAAQMSLVRTDGSAGYCSGRGGD
jgi:hypothetical protein